MVWEAKGHDPLSQLHFKIVHGVCALGNQRGGAGDRTSRAADRGPGRHRHGDRMGTNGHKPVPATSPEPERITAEAASLASAAG